MGQKVARASWHSYTKLMEDLGIQKGEGMS